MRVKYIVVEGEHDITWFAEVDYKPERWGMIMPVLRRVQRLGNFKIWFWPQHEVEIRNIHKDNIDVLIEELEKNRTTPYTLAGK